GDVAAGAREDGLQRRLVGGRGPSQRRGDQHTDGDPHVISSRAPAGMLLRPVAPGQADTVGFGVRRSAFGVQGSGGRVQGSGFRVQGSGLRFLGSRFSVLGSWFSVWFQGSPESNPRTPLRTDEPTNREPNRRTPNRRNPNREPANP